MELLPSTYGTLRRASPPFPRPPLHRDRKCFEPCSVHRRGPLRYRLVVADNKQKKHPNLAMSRPRRLIVGMVGWPRDIKTNQSRPKECRSALRSGAAPRLKTDRQPSAACGDRQRGHSSAAGRPPLLAAWPRPSHPPKSLPSVEPRPVDKPAVQQPAKKYRVAMPPRCSPRGGASGGQPRVYPKKKVVGTTAGRRPVIGALVVHALDEQHLRRSCMFPRIVISVAPGCGRPARSPAAQIGGRRGRLAIKSSVRGTGNLARESAQRPAANPATGPRIGRHT